MTSELEHIIKQAEADRANWKIGDPATPAMRAEDAAIGAAYDVLDPGDDEDEWDSCPMCGESNPPMNALGWLIWYRCQYCGMDYNRKDDTLPAFKDV